MVVGSFSALTGCPLARAPPTCATRCRSFRVRTEVPHPSEWPMHTRPGPSVFGSSSRSSAVRRGTSLPAVFEKFTERAIKTVMLAQHEARQLGYFEVGTEHILLGLIAEDREQFYGTGISLERARGAVSRTSGRRANQKSPKNELPFSRNAKGVFEAALVEAQRMAMNYIAPEHICIALMGASKSGAASVLAELGVQGDLLKRRVQTRLTGDGQAAKAKAAAAATSGKKKDERPALDQFCRDLSAEAEAGRIDPVIGREAEVVRVCQILARRRKNNPILLGEPGTGKTAVAEGLALLIASGGTLHGAPLPSVLQGVRVLQLDIGLLLAGAKERGELERRVAAILDACRERRGSLVLVIDEVHTLVGAGSVSRGSREGGGGLDVANLLKPALAAGDLQCIGATTMREYRMHIERDPALARRFQPVPIAEPSPAQAVVILSGLQSRYEAHHRCAYTEGAIARTVELAHRYVADRFLPDKAIDVMDEAGSRARIAASAAASAPDTAQYAELLQVLEAKDEAVRHGHYEEAELLRSRELDLKERLVGPPAAGTPVALVDIAAVDAIVAQWTGIPVERLSAGEAERVLGLGAVLGERVVGQEGAVSAVARAVQRARAGMRAEARPIATLLFTGPTGVGKTCLTQRLAEHLYGSKAALIRLDMSEFMERHSVSKLIGPPPGYVGFGEGGKLTDAVRRRPACVILLDEIEKAHPDVFNILLQVVEDGRLTDSQGRTVSFRDALLVLTSNIGSAHTSRDSAPLGFSLPADLGEGQDSEAAAEAAAYARMTEAVHDDLKGFFRPEFLNRLDEVVVFSPLHVRHMRVVAETMVAETAARVAALGLTLTLTSAALTLLCATGFAPDQGARQLRRSVVNLLEDPLADALLTGRAAAGDDVVMDARDGEMVLLIRGVASAGKRGKARASVASAGQGVEVEGFPAPVDVVGAPVLPVSASA